jgi:hypothetical protein
MPARPKISPHIFNPTIHQTKLQRHGKRFKKLGKAADARKALLRALTTEAIRHGRIKTTLIRAKVRGCCSWLRVWEYSA